MRKLALFLGCLMFLLVGSSAFAGTYYIDCAAGSDLNNGASQTKAWLHHPYMVGFKGSYSHSPGDQFYFKGGITCPASYFPLTVAAGGSPGAGYDYYGPDPTQSWFVGSSWSRPTFGLAGKTIGTANRMFVFGPNDYVWADNFEVTGFTDNNDNFYQDNTAFLLAYSNLHQKVTEMYFHAWVIPSGTTHDDIEFIGGNNSGDQSLVIVDQNYCNGVDASPPSTSAGHGSTECIRYLEGTITNNVMLNESNCIVFGGGAGVIAANNDCSSIWMSYDSTLHENLFEFQPNNGNVNIIYNNKIHDSQYGWAMSLAPSAGGTDWVFNNICWNVGTDCFDIDTQGNFPTYTANFYNNTAKPGGSFRCMATTDRGSSNSVGTVNLINNHCITTNGTDAEAFCFNGGSACSGVTAMTKTTNVLMSAALAAIQGFTSSEAYVYSPTSASNSTVGAGTNLASNCSTSTAALCSETTYSCSVGAGNALVCPIRTPLSRAESGTCSAGVPGCWDAGAHLFSSDNNAPNPPTNLKASVQ